MPRIARSTEPLYQTRGRPVHAALAITLPTGGAADLTGCSASASLRWSGAVRPLNVAPLDATGLIIGTGLATLTSDLPLGRITELVVTLTDTQGGILDIVADVIGEVP